MAALALLCYLSYINDKLNQQSIKACERGLGHRICEFETHPLPAVVWWRAKQSG